MKLNKPIFTIILIILLVIDLIFFSIVLIGKKVFEKDNVREIVYSFNYIEYLKDNESIKNSVDNYKYPFEVFNYIDDKDVKKEEDKFIDNLYSNKKLIEYEDVLQILNSAIDLYEKDNLVDIHTYIDDDVKEVSKELSNVDEDFGMSFNFINNFVNSGIIYIFMIIAIAASIFIIVFEKINGCLINSIIYLLYSLAMYYMKYNSFPKVYINKDISKYLMDFSSKIVYLDNIYVICFILGFVLLLIYVIKLISRVIRNVRLNSYDSWR